PRGVPPLRDGSRDPPPRRREPLGAGAGPRRHRTGRARPRRPHAMTPVPRAVALLAVGTIVAPAAGCDDPARALPPAIEGAGGAGALPPPDPADDGWCHPGGRYGGTPFGDACVAFAGAVCASRE